MRSYQYSHSHVLLCFCIILSLSLSVSNQAVSQSAYLEITIGPSRPLPPDIFGQDASDIIYYRSLNDSVLRTKIPLIQPGTIRHVSSSQSNWWDWRTGWLLSQDDMPPGYLVRDDWTILSPKADKISDLKPMVDTTGARALFVPNMITSRLDYQVAALFEFGYQNIRTPYVEMGCEFYLDNNELAQRFSTSIQYADTASKWIPAFKALFPGLKIALIGATEQGASGRRNTWTQNVVDHASGYDAISLHAYLPTGLHLNDSIIPPFAIPTLFAKPFLAMEPSGEVGHELTKLDSTTELWISEYNLTDRQYVIMGDWAQGLFVAALTLSFLSNDRITHINQFQMSSDAFHGNVFATANGFDAGPGFKTLDPNLPTKPGEFTATGNAMILPGRSLKQATAISPLVFTPHNGAVIGELEGGYSALYGYKVAKPFSDELILMNLSGDSTKLVYGPLFSSNAVNYELMWCTTDLDNRPFVPITGDMPIASGINSSGQIYIPPYAILRLYQNKNKIYAQATDDTICEGTSTTIISYGATQYSWSPQVTASGNEAVAYVSPDTTTTYTVTAIEGCTGSECTTSVSIHVSKRPQQGTIAVEPSSTVCPDTKVLLTVTGTDANQFCWTSPGVGSQFMQSSVDFIATDTTTYYVFGALDGCYSYRDSVTIYVRPSANAGPDQLACITDSVLIGTPANEGLLYEWSPSTGLSDPNIAQPKAAPPIETSYVLTLTDPATGCTDADSLIVNPVTCCTAPSSTPVFSPNTTASQFLDVMKSQFGANVNLTLHTLKNYQGDIIINGSFLVDSDLTIVNCPKIKFGEHARIIVNTPYVLLKLENDSLFACGLFRWSGIAQSNLLSKLNIDSTYIADADTALSVTNDVVFQATNDHFYNNRFGIVMSNYIGALWSENTAIKIYGNIFEGDTTSLSGITANGVNTVAIGQESANPNTFRNMMNGVRITNANANIVNNEFINMLTGIEVTDTFSNPDLSPIYGITIGGEALSKANFFDSLNTAIQATNMNLTLSGNNIDDCEYGIQISNSLSTSVTISKNYFNNAFKGINFTGNKNSHYLIKNNSISTKSGGNNYYPVAINVTDLSTEAGISGIADITGNSIQSRGFSAILLTNNNGYGYDPSVEITPKISDNIIHIISPDNLSKKQSGILLEHCVRNNIIGNLITGNATPDNQTEGINLFDAGFTQVFCNTFDSIANGIVFIGTNYNDSVWSNIFIDADTCIKVGQSFILYGNLNNQTGSGFYTPGNQFLDLSAIHLMKLDSSFIEYYTGNDEQFPPLNIFHFNLQKVNIPSFTCMNMLPGDTSALIQPCWSESATHLELETIVEQYDVNGIALVTQNENFLWSIANQCPLSCGDDIFLARALLQTKYDNLLFNDDSLCAKAPVDTSTHDVTPPFNIYPNPASASVNIQYNLPANGAYTLKIIDVVGREIEHFTLSGAVHETNIDLDGLSSGCYLLSLFAGNTRIRTNKLIVIR